MKWLHSTWAIVGALALTALLSYGSIRSYMRNYNINKEIAGLQAKQSALEKERANLSSLLKNIQSEAFAEEQAREQFGLRKPGEKAIVIERQDAPNEQNDTKTDGQNLTNPQRWWRYFFSTRPDERG